MGRGGFSGGSFGGRGGGGSFGGRSGGGGFNRGGVFGGGSFRPPSSGGHQPFPPLMGGFSMGYGMGRMSGGFGHRPPGSRRPGFGGGGGFIVVFVWILVIAGALSFFSDSGRAVAGGVTASTVRREALPKGAVIETEYYTDELGWIDNSTALVAGMKNFYQKTGVQPYLYITDAIGGSHNPTEIQAEQFAVATYDALFQDQAHLLLIFFEYNNRYHIWYRAGGQAKTVLDTEAMDILMDYVERYYYDQELTDAEMFSKAFDQAGTRIMRVTVPFWIPALTAIGLLAIFTVAFLWWKSYKKQKNLEAERDREILETPLETFGDADAEERAKKYEE